MVVALKHVRTSTRPASIQSLVLHVTQRRVDGLPTAVLSFLTPPFSALSPSLLWHTAAVLTRAHAVKGASQSPATQPRRCTLQIACGTVSPSRQANTALHHETPTARSHRPRDHGDHQQAATSSQRAYAARAHSRRPRKRSMRRLHREESGMGELEPGHIPVHAVCGIAPKAGNSRVQSQVAVDGLVEC